MHHKIPWSIKTKPNPQNGPSKDSRSKQTLMVPTPTNVSFHAHVDEINIDHDFPTMFENAQTNQIMDPSNLHDAIINVIERWEFGLKVKHQTQTYVAQLRPWPNSHKSKSWNCRDNCKIWNHEPKRLTVKLLNYVNNWRNCSCER
jgi:hypothetical protein